MSTQQELAWWQKLLVALKLWRPTYRTLHHELRDLEAPKMPEITGMHGNQVNLSRKRNLVPQRGDDNV